MFMITEKAANKVKEISDDEGIGHFSIRVKLSAGGCAGFFRELEFDNSPRDTDEIIEFDGIQIIIDQISFQYLQETTVDYESGIMESGFKFKSDNAITSCGCQKSVGF